MKKFILIALFIITLFMNTCVSANSVECTFEYERTDSGKLFYDIATNENAAVLVGKTGRIFRLDYNEWREVETGYFNTFEKVEYGAIGFVAISKEVALQSLDGEKWTLLSSDLNYADNGLFIYSNNAYIIEKNDGVYSTVDFITYNKVLDGLVQSNKIIFSNQKDIFYDIKSKPQYDFAKIISNYNTVFGEKDVLNTYSFNQKLKLFISLSGITPSAFPISLDSISYIDCFENNLSIYYVKNGRLIKSTTNDFDNWIDTEINLPGKNEHLSNAIVGKWNNKYLIVYDTNELDGKRSKQSYSVTEDLVKFEQLSVTSVRGNVYAQGDKIFIITASELYSLEKGEFIKQLSAEALIKEKDDCISTEKNDFLWKREDGIKLYIGKNDTWQLIENPDPFLTSHYIDGNANYQIIWTGTNYFIRPTDYDNGYNPTGAKGTINVYDENINFIRTITANEYILQMSFVNDKCYVITSSNTVLSLSKDDVFNVENRISLPMSNNKTEVYKTLTPKENGYGYIHDIVGIINDNIEKKIRYENWKGLNVDIIGDYYVRYDDSIFSISDDSVYWVDVTLPSGLKNVQNVNIINDKIVVTTPSIILNYSLVDVFQKKEKAYVEVNGEILAFDTVPVIESDRTLVPMRLLFEHMGANVDWENETQTAIVLSNNDKITFSINNTVAKVNGELKTMDVPARLINDKTLVPLRFLSEELGFTVEWNEETKTATISK